MFDFVTDGGPPGEDATVWSRLPVQGLAAGVLTPFSLSVICEIAGRAVYDYYDRLGIEPPPRQQTVRTSQGRIYLNLTAPARLETVFAGADPPTLRINGDLHPLGTAAKRSLFGGLKASRGQKKIDALLDELGDGIDTASRTAHYWLQKTRAMQWTQAEVLQVMEEIERVGVESMMAFLAARNNLDLLYNRLITASLDSANFPASLALINAALGDLDSLVETGMAAALVELSDELAGDAQVTAWLAGGNFDNWEETAPNEETLEGLAAFLGTYGHRAVDEAEIARPRWYENPVPVMHGLLAAIEHRAKRPARSSSLQSVQRLLDTVDPQTARTVPAMISRMRLFQHMQSHALHTLAYVWAGTREWAKAAASEAATDGRLQNWEDVFFFELEEIKQMMTGEWNVNNLDGIRAAIEQRKTEYVAWREVVAPPLLIDDRPAWFAQRGLPASPGHATAPLRRLTDARIHSCKGAILGTEHLDSGWALVLPVANGFVAAEGTPADACVAAARAWHRPATVALGDDFNRLLEGAQTTVDGDAGRVEQ